MQTNQIPFLPVEFSSHRLQCARSDDHRSGAQIDRSDREGGEGGRGLEYTHPYIRHQLLLIIQRTAALLFISMGLSWDVQLP